MTHSNPLQTLSAPVRAPNNRMPAKLPSVFTLEITTACHHFCSGCANTQLSRVKSGRRDTTHYMKDWKTVIDKIQPVAKVVRLSGGEPTLHPDFFEIVQYLEARQIQHSLFSTGYWSDSKRLKIIELYQKCDYFVGILVSLHGTTAAAHAAFVEQSPLIFETTCQNIRELSQSGLPVFTNTVITKYNYATIGAMSAFSCELGAQYAIFNRFLGDKHSIEPTQEGLKQAIADLNALRESGKKVRLGNSIPHCFISNGSSGSQAGYELCHLDPKGNVRPDNLLSLSFGNLFQQDLATIWKSELADNYRNTYPKNCNNCTAFAYCRGGSKSLFWQYGWTQDPLMQSPLQQYTYTKSNADEQESNRFLALSSDI
jgi:AdoMet-dependent heme synthase